MGAESQQTLFLESSNVKCERESVRESRRVVQLLSAVQKRVESEIRNALLIQQSRCTGRMSDLHSVLICFTPAIDAAAGALMLTEVSATLQLLWSCCSIILAVLPLCCMQHAFIYVCLIDMLP